jgi:hypothetical protein
VNGQSYILSLSEGGPRENCLLRTKFELETTGRRDFSSKLVDRALLVISLPRDPICTATNVFGWQRGMYSVSTPCVTVISHRITMHTLLQSQKGQGNSRTVAWKIYCLLISFTNLVHLLFCSSVHGTLPSSSTGGPCRPRI